MVNGEWSRAAAAVAALLLAACRGGEERVLGVAETVRLDGVAAEARTLAIGPAGWWWLGGDAGVAIRGPGEVLRPLAAAAGEPPTVAGWMGERAYLRWGDSVGVVTQAPDSVAAVRAGFGRGVLAVDPRGRTLFQGAGSGAVLLHDPATLQPVSAWAAIARRSTAIAVSPEGDRLYQAVEAGNDAAILIRDLQTGRILGEMEIEEPVQALVTGGEGMLYGASLEGRRIRVVALRAEGESLEELWRMRGSAGSEEGEGVKLRQKGRVLAFGPAAPGGTVRLLDAAEGRVLGRAPGEPLDFDLSPAGELWVLYRGVVRRLR